MTNTKAVLPWWRGKKLWFVDFINIAEAEGWASRIDLFNANERNLFRARCVIGRIKLKEANDG